MTTPSSIPVYTQGYGTAFTGATFVSPIAPSASNTVGPNGPFKIGQIWIDSSEKKGYILVSLTASSGIVSGSWQPFSSSSGLLDTLTGNSGVATPVADNINVVGTGTISTTGSVGNLTISPTVGGFPITPFVVGPVGKAGYQTIQSAINAANSAGGGEVYIQPGSYTENLTIYTGVSLIGVNINVSYPFPVSSFVTSITGNHTVAVGNSPLPIGIDSINFISSSNTFSTLAAIPVGMIINNSNFRASNNNVISIPNLTFTSNVYFVFQNSNIFDGGLINVPSGNLNVVNSSLALNGGSPIMTNNGTWTFNNVYCPAPMSGTGTLTAVNCDFEDTLAFAGTGSVFLSYCSLLTGSDPAIIVNANATFQITSCVIASTAVNPISGNSAGTNYSVDTTFSRNHAILSTLNVITTDTHLSGQALIGTIIPDASAILNVASTTQGFLPPRMTTVQKNAIASPAEGLVVYDTNLHQLSYYNGTVWINL